MFRIITTQTEADGAISLGNNVTNTNNVRDIYDILLNLGFGLDDAKRYTNIASNMKHEDILENRKIIIFCYNEEE